MRSLLPQAERGRESSPAVRRGYMDDCRNARVDRTTVARRGVVRGWLPAAADLAGSGLLNSEVLQPVRWRVYGPISSCAAASRTRGRLAPLRRMVE